MSKHTPGPWHVSATGRYIRHTQSDLTRPNVCDLKVFGGPPEEAGANARLIAAAPDLLATLKVLCDWYKMSEGRGAGPNSYSLLFDDDQTLIDHIESAIAKAEGK